MRYEARVVSHRTPDLLFDYATTARARGLQAIIAGAGGAPSAGHAGVQDAGAGRAGAFKTSERPRLPAFHGAMVHMPKGVPVATFAIGVSGSTNAAMFVVAMLWRPAAWMLTLKLRELIPTHGRDVFANKSTLMG